MATNDYGTKAQLSRWKEANLNDTNKRFKALQKSNPEKFKPSEVSQTSDSARKKPTVKRQKTSEEQVKTDYKMVLIEGKTIVEDDFMIEEKPLATQNRDPATFAY